MWPATQACTHQECELVALLTHTGGAQLLLPPHGRLIQVASQLTGQADAADGGRKLLSRQVGRQAGRKSADVCAGVLMGCSCRT